MDETPRQRAPALSLRAGVGLAIGGILAWFTALALLHPEVIVDERLHFQVITNCAAGDWRQPLYLPMPPIYHIFAGGAANLFGVNLLVVRALNTVLSVATILLYAAIVRRRSADRHRDGFVVLHLGWLPILFPFLVLAYTEASSLLCVIAALYLHVRRRFVAAAGAMLVACLIRQSNLAWTVFLVCWAVVELWPRRSLEHPRLPGSANAEQEDSGTVSDSTPATRGGTCASTRPVLKKLAPRVDPPRLGRKIASRTAGYLVVLGLATAFFIHQGGFMAGNLEANRVRFNVAQFFAFMLFVILLWGPLLYELGGAVWADLYQQAGRRGPRGWAVLLLVPAAVVVLAAVYDNPHPWNQSDGFLRNWPLQAMAASAPARFLGAAAIVAAVPVLVRFTRSQPDRFMLALVWLLSFLFLIPHALVDPRYYIIPAVLLNLFTRYTPAQARRLAWWYGSVSAAVAVFVVVRGNYLGGIW